MILESRGQHNSRRRRARLARRWQRTTEVAPSEPATPEEILVTYKLQSRRGRKQNFRDESIALRDLAKVMANSPSRLIDKLLETSLELCSAGTAGLSLLETTPEGEQIFRCTNLAEALPEHIGGTTPRNFSPCGVTLDRNVPQLFSYPGHRFQYFNGLACTIVEALVIPIYLGDKTPGTIWIVSHDEEVKFDSEDARIMTELAEFTSCALRLIRSSETQQTARVEAEKEIATRKSTEKSLRRTQAGLEVDIDARTAQLQQLSVKLMNLQDDERRRLARDLHDSTGQYLAGIQMNLNSLLRAGSGLIAAYKSRVYDSISLVNSCTSEIRTMSYLLHPPLLDEMGLRSAILMYVEGFAERSGIRVELEIPDDFGRLSSEMETALFRVIQQSLANVHRHSGSLVACLRIASDGESITVEISDEGCGIPPETLRGFYSGTKLSGVGIAGIRERTKSMGGHFDIRSGEKGTTIQVRLPLVASAQSASA
jgi:signal transduction histidine kinase